MGSRLWISFLQHFERWLCCHLPWARWVESVALSFSFLLSQADLQFCVDSRERAVLRVPSTSADVFPILCSVLRIPFWPENLHCPSLWGRTFQISQLQVFHPHRPPTLPQTSYSPTDSILSLRLPTPPQTPYPLTDPLPSHRSPTLSQAPYPPVAFHRRLLHQSLPEFLGFLFAFPIPICFWHITWLACYLSKSLFSLPL